jgi:hypothetical protein
VRLRSRTIASPSNPVDLARIVDALLPRSAGSSPRWTTDCRRTRRSATSAWPADRELDQERAADILGDGPRRRRHVLEDLDEVAEQLLAKMEPGKAAR